MASGRPWRNGGSSAVSTASARRDAGRARAPQTPAVSRLRASACGERGSILHGALELLD